MREETAQKFKSVGRSSFEVEVHQKTASLQRTSLGKEPGELAGPEAPRSPGRHQLLLRWWFRVGAEGRISPCLLCKKPKLWGGELVMQMRTRASWMMFFQLPMLIRKVTCVEPMVAKRKDLQLGLIRLSRDSFCFFLYYHLLMVFHKNWNMVLHFSGQTQYSGGRWG